MFDLGWAEMLLLGIVVLLVMGPRELPTMLRTLGRLAGRMRAVTQTFRSQIDEITREVDPRADLQRITYSHPFEEDVGTPTLFDQPLDDAPSTSGDASEKVAPKKKSVSKKKPVAKKKVTSKNPVAKKKPVVKKKPVAKKKVVSKKGDDDGRQ